MKERSDRKSRSEECGIELSGFKHQCRLENISSSGAMVNCTGFLQETWPGDNCSLHLHHPEEEITCRVIHISASKIGLQFLDPDAG